MGLDIKDEQEASRAETLLRGAATRVLPGWNAVALEGIEVLRADARSSEDRAALRRAAAVFF